MRRENCSACGDLDLETFLDLGTSPIADAYADKPNLDAPRYPLQMATCSTCRLVQLREVIDPNVLFNDGYSFYSSQSPPLVKYHEKYAADLLAQVRDQATMGVLEIGCNDGDLLRHFSHLPHLGVDPTGGPVTVAIERGLDVVHEPFTLTLAQDLDRTFGLVLANHVLAHVVDVYDMLAGISHVLHPEGIAFIEVQYLPDLLVNNAFDLAYHEHRNFFSLRSLESALWRHNLRVIDAELTDRQGGSLRVAIVPKGSQTSSTGTELQKLRASEGWLDNRDAYQGMQGRAERIRTRLQDVLEQESGAGRQVVGYGAPAKATTLLNFCHIDSGSLGFVMDPAPSKIGKYVPGTDIQIIAPDHTMNNPKATVLLLAWNYASAIMRQYGSFSTGGGRWIIPFPAPMLL
jgi:SAM-dependent methyltransferase